MLVIFQNPKCLIIATSHIPKQFTQFFQYLGFWHAQTIQEMADLNQCKQHRKWQIISDKNFIPFDVLAFPSPQVLHQICFEIMMSLWISNWTMPSYMLARLNLFSSDLHLLHWTMASHFAPSHLQQSRYLNLCNKWCVHKLHPFVTTCTSFEQ